MGPNTLGMGQCKSIEILLDIPNFGMLKYMIRAIDSVEEDYNELGSDDISLEKKAKFVSQPSLSCEAQKKVRIQATNPTRESEREVGEEEFDAKLDRGDEVSLGFLVACGCGCDCGGFCISRDGGKPWLGFRMKRDKIGDRNKSCSFYPIDVGFLIGNEEREWKPPSVMGPPSMVEKSVMSPFLGTFILVYTVFSATDPKRSARDSHVPILTPLPIGFVVFMVHLATIPITGTGTGIYPARSLGATVIYNQDKAKDDQWLFWVGPFIGVAIEAFYHQFILRASAAKALGSFRSNSRD
ncbi:hypothetical protein LguiB_010440 [Lonicera macranthoides]